MSLEAYRSLEDKKNNITTKSSECTAIDINHVFYCLNPKCTAHLTLCAFENGKRTPYFACTNKNFPHIENYDYHSSNSSYLSKFNHKDFDPKDFLHNITINSSSKKSSNKSYSSSGFHQANNLMDIHTIRQLYKICISNPLNDYIGNTKILNLLCNDATQYLYTKYIKGIKLMVCEFDYINYKTRCIVANYPINSLGFVVFVNFYSIDTFFHIERKFKDYKGKIIIYADFSSKYIDSKQKYAWCHIHSINQIVPIKD